MRIAKSLSLNMLFSIANYLIHFFIGYYGPCKLFIKLFQSIYVFVVFGINLSISISGGGRIFTFNNFSYVDLDFIIVYLLNIEF